MSDFDLRLWFTWILAHMLAVPAGLFVGSWADPILTYLLFALLVSLAQAMVIRAQTPEPQKTVRMVNWGGASFLGWGLGLLFAEIGVRVSETAVDTIFNFHPVAFLWGIIGSTLFQFMAHWRVRYRNPLLFVWLLAVAWISGYIGFRLLADVVSGISSLTQTLLWTALLAGVSGGLTGTSVFLFPVDTNET